MRPTWGRQDPGWPHELCYLGLEHHLSIQQDVLVEDITKSRLYSIGCSDVRIALRFGAWQIPKRLKNS